MRTQPLINKHFLSPTRNVCTGSLVRNPVLESAGKLSKRHKSTAAVTRGGDFPISFSHDEC